MSAFPPERIRNFCIIAHIDHGKSTLADRLLEVTGTVRKATPQFLDKLPVERQRGITVKAQTVSLVHTSRERGRYLLNLIDTPGHVDFAYEVSRSVAAAQGAVMLVDGVQGIQAQTVANYHLALSFGLALLPVINKIDQSAADPPAIAAQMQQAFALHPDSILMASAKTGQGVHAILEAIVDRLPPPGGHVHAPPRALVFDSWFDEFKGVVLLIAVIDGSFAKRDRVRMHHTAREYEIEDMGVMHPHQLPTPHLRTGQVGYVITNMKTAREAILGDTMCSATSASSAAVVPFTQPNPMVFSGVFPLDSDEYEHLRSAIDKLCLTDGSVTVSPESSLCLGQGFRCGFLGLLHMSVFLQRLQQEYDANVLCTPPTVPYKVDLKNGSEVLVETAAAFPPPDTIARVHERLVNASIMCLPDHLGPIIQLLQGRRGTQVEIQYVGQRVVLQYAIPLAQVITTLSDDIKSISSGYASFDYKMGEWQPSSIVKVNALLNGDRVDALAAIVHEQDALPRARAIVAALKEHIPRQLFDLRIQAAIGSKVVVTERLTAVRKNVLAKCYGGDITRKKKLLEKQKEGKKKLKEVGLGNITLSHTALVAIMRS